MNASDMEQLHERLALQVKKYLPERIILNPEMNDFLMAISDTYLEMDKLNRENSAKGLSEENTQIINYAKNLEKINKELDQFAYIISHDLKAPLRAITNLSEWIEEDLRDKMDEATHKNFDLLRSRIKRMESLISGVLDYSRAGRIKHSTEMIQIRPFLEELISSLSPPSSFRILIQEKFPALNIEKLALEQVFSNLISNVIKYNSSPEPYIKIYHIEDESGYIFTVEDNGPGIEKSFHEKIFQIFQTLQSRDIIESTGVGLSIAKKIIEEKGGKIWVESEPGAGAKFQFTIPKTTDKK